MTNTRASDQESSTQNYRVSPRILGQMRKPDFCLTAFRFAIGLGFKYPYEFPMPGLMHNMDRFEKRFVDAYFDDNGYLPKWLKYLGCTEPAKFPAKLTEDFPDLELTLVGMPDAVFRKKNGDLVVVDYKTAKCKGDDDPFMPIYQAQLWGYARLLESNGIGKVSGASLVYFENRLADHKDSPLDLLSGDGMKVPFEVTTHPVHIDLEALDGLLKKFREYADMTGPLTYCECKTCVSLQRLIAIEKKLSCRQKLIKDMLYRDRAGLERILWQQDSYLHDSMTKASHEWEANLDDLLSADTDSVPGPLDL